LILIFSVFYCVFVSFVLRLACLVNIFGIALPCFVSGLAKIFRTLPCLLTLFVTLSIQDVKGQTLAFAPDGSQLFTSNFSAFQRPYSTLPEQKTRGSVPLDEIYIENPGAVKGRFRPDFDPLGARLDSFVFLPSLSSQSRVESNALASRFNRQQDWSYVVSPRLSLQSDWSAHALSVDIGADVTRYHRLTSENLEDFGAQIRHRLDITRDVNVLTTLKAARLHEPRSASTAIAQAVSAGAYDTAMVDVTLNHSFNRLGYSLGANVSRNAYEAVALRDGGIASQRPRSGYTTTLTLRPFYELSPGYRVFVQTQLIARHLEGKGVNERDSRGYNALSGVEFALSQQLVGQLGVGYISQDYTNPLLRTVEGLATSASLTWNPTPLMTIRTGVERQVAETLSVVTPSQLATSVYGTVDYEILRNVVASWGGRYTVYDRTLAASDTLISVNAQLDYLINRTLHAGIFYGYQSRHSEGLLDQHYQQHKVGLHVKSQY
jgi:hypothetical protein